MVTHAFQAHKTEKVKTNVFMLGAIKIVYINPIFTGHRVHLKHSAHFRADTLDSSPIITGRLINSEFIQLCC